MGRPVPERGFALVIVLWTMVLLTQLTMQIVSSGRTEVQMARNLRDAAVVEAAADGAVYQSIFHLLATGDQHWASRGWHRIMLPGVDVQLQIDDLSGRVNPNVASPELLTALLMALGLGSGRATSLSDAIVDWRMPGSHGRPHGAKIPQYRAAGLDYDPPGSSFGDIEELGAVLGMTPDVLALLRPHVTVWWDGNPDPAFADPVILAALRSLSDSDIWMDTGLPRKTVVSITAAAVSSQGTRFTREIVAVVDTGSNPQPWHIVEWLSPSAF